MSKHFKNISSLENLKNTYRELLKQNHPDNGGDSETMKEINVEYDSLFAIWKNRKETETGEKVHETAQSTRKHFYTQFGWQGDNYDDNLSTKEAAKRIRCYVKEKYPTWKFSVTYKSFSMGSSITILVLEAPVNIFDLEYFKKDLEERRDCYDFDTMYKKNEYNMSIHNVSSNREDYPFFNEIGYDVLHDVFCYAQSYRYNDSDSSIDYFSTNFYLHFNIGNYEKPFRIVPKTARISKSKQEMATCSENEYMVEKSKHTKTGETIWLVKVINNLSKEEYIKENQKMKQLGGYYSRFTHSFVFKEDPSEKLGFTCQ